MKKYTKDEVVGILAGIRKRSMQILSGYGLDTDSYCREDYTEDNINELIDEIILDLVTKKD